MTSTPNSLSPGTPHNVADRSGTIQNDLSNALHTSEQKRPNSEKKITEMESDEIQFFDDLVSIGVAQKTHRNTYRLTDVGNWLVFSTNKKSKKFRMSNETIFKSSYWPLTKEFFRENAKKYLSTSNTHQPTEEKRKIQTTPDILNKYNLEDTKLLLSFLVLPSIKRSEKVFTILWKNSKNLQNVKGRLKDRGTMKSYNKMGQLDIISIPGILPTNIIIDIADLSNNLDADELDPFINQYLGKSSAVSNAQELKSAIKNCLDTEGIAALNNIQEHYEVIIKYSELLDAISDIGRNSATAAHVFVEEVIISNNVPSPLGKEDINHLLNTQNLLTKSKINAMIKAMIKAKLLYKNTDKTYSFSEEISDYIAERKSKL